MTDFPACYVIPPGASVTLGDPGLKASGHSTGGALSVVETSIDAGPPLHVHDREDECFYVLDGGLSVRCGSEVFDAARGSFVFLPRGRPHLCVPKTSSTSCDQAVFVDQATDASLSSDTAPAEIDWLG
jgi:mannose-6-phosphate isomerase-like protein (cupin superfamily)